MVVIPFSIIPPKALARFSDKFMGLGLSLSRLNPHMQVDLDRSDIHISAQRYLAMCALASIVLQVFLMVGFTMLMDKLGDWFLGPVLSLIFGAFIFFLQVNYPKVKSRRRIRQLDSDLLSGLRAILIQLNSGVALFEALVIISMQEFGEISREFKWVVKQINAGVPQIEALESMAVKNPSPYFRRAIWQVINGMKEGSEVVTIIDQVITNLTKEQLIQIERYGSQLNPLAMFYMMVAVIMPALGVTFIIVLASFVGLNELLVKVMFFGLAGFVLFAQFMFSGVVKAKRPSLLGE